ncbi:MAG: hypothetical protein Q9227_007000 [Pyrenula ochraceoflavens]
MASGGELFFPPLDRCLSGEVLLISWREVHIFLSAEVPIRQPSKLYSFLSSEQVLRIIADPTNPFHRPSPQTKASFDTRTAAINITPSSHGQYNLDEIKDDALWLSKEADIDEESALRLAILEWQYRPVGYLQRGFTEAEKASVRESFGAQNLSLAQKDNTALEALLKNDNNSEGFLSAESRRLRLLTIFLSERCALVDVTKNLLSAAFSEPRSDLDPNEKDDGRVDSNNMLGAAEELGNKVLDYQSKMYQDDPQGRLMDVYITALKDRIEKIEQGCNWLQNTELTDELENVWLDTNLKEMISIMELAFLHLRAFLTILNAQVVLNWLGLMAQYTFFEQIELGSQAQLPLLNALQSLTPLVTLAVLNVNDCIQHLLQSPQRSFEENDSSHHYYFLDREYIDDIHRIFLDAAATRSRIASVPVLAWGLLCYTIRDAASVMRETREMQHADSFRGRHSGSSTTSLHQSLYDEVADHLRHASGGTNYPEYLFHAATEETGVFDVLSLLAGGPNPELPLGNRWKRICLQELVSLAFETAGYSEEVLTGLFSTLEEPSYLTFSNFDSNTLPQYDPRSIFITDEYLMGSIFDLALKRFPREAVTFLHLCRLLASSQLVNKSGLPIIADRLRSVETFTQAIPSSFQGYSTTREEENANWVRLLESLNMYGETAQPMITYHNNSTISQSSKDIIAPGTEGQVVSAGRPIVICWSHGYSILSYLGRWLHEIRRRRFSPSPFVDSPSIIAAETIGLLSALTSAIMRNGGDVDIAREVLEDASIDGAEEDILSIVSDIFEQELEEMSYRANFERSVDLLGACVDFFHATIPILPGRIWPILQQSKFLGKDGIGGLLASVVLSIEVSSTNFTFLEKSMALFEALIEDAISCSLSQTGTRSSLATSRDVPATTSHTPVRVRGEILLSFTQATFQFYGSMFSWTFRDPLQRARVFISMATSFKKMIYYWYGIDDTQDLKTKLTAAVAASASFLIESLDPPSTQDGLMNPVLKAIADGLKLANPCAGVSLTNAWRNGVRASVELSLQLLEARKVLDGSFSKNHQLLNASPIFVRLFAYDYFSKSAILKLLDGLLDKEQTSAGSDSQSLLGQLGSDSSRTLIELISYMDQPFEDSMLLVDIWSLLNSLVQKRQQWFAVVMLTGSVSQAQSRSPSAVDQKTGTSLRGKSILMRALDYLAKDRAPRDPLVSPHVLSFVRQAQENWPWATLSMWSHEGFIRFIAEYFRDLKHHAPANPLDECRQTQTSATMAKILTSYLHRIRATRDRAAFTSLRGAIEHYAEGGKPRLGYNDSLHANLKENVKRIFPGCELSKFKKINSTASEYGNNFYYDVVFAGKVLGFSQAWKGTRGQGLEQEFWRANVNLSLVDAQLHLWNSWKSLAIEHSPYFAIDGEVRKFMAKAIERCMESNTLDYPADSIFDRVLQSRIELAIALLQRLVVAKTRAIELVHLLEVAWTTLTSHTTSYEAAAANSDLPYFRSLLNAVFLTIQFHVKVNPTKSDRQESTKNILLDLLTNVVAKGLKSLVTILHSQSDSGDADSQVGVIDFRLLLALLQAIIRVPDLHVSGSSRASEALLLSPISESALHLYSWSHTLLAPDSDPVYAPISSSFLATLSSLPLLAEDLAASQNILPSLASARMTRLLMARPNGAGPLDTEILPQRLYETWTRGILPLCLNLLQAVGRALSADVLHFLNLIPIQLQRASLSLNAQGGAGSLTLSCVKEVQDLAVIAAVLDRYREAGQSAGVDPLEMLEELKWWSKSDRKGVREDVDDLLASRAKMRLRLVPGDEREAALMQKSPQEENRRGKEGCLNALEEKVVEELKKCLVCLRAEGED